jgi:hypothetical protein
MLTHLLATFRLLRAARTNSVTLRAVIEDDWSLDLRSGWA